MSDKNIDLSRRKVLGSLGVIGVASAGAGAGTFAYFSDTESSTGNTISAGTLNLTADGNDGSATTTVSVDDVAPGETGSDSTTLVNAGSVSGYLNFDVAPISNRENGVIDPEEGSSGENGGDPGELGAVLDVRYGFDTTGDGAIDVPVVDTTDKPYEAVERTGGAEYNPNLPLSANGGSADFVVDWALPSDAGNAVQGDGVEFDATFELLQEPAGSDVVLTGNSPYSDAKGFPGSFAPESAESRVGAGSWQATTSGQEGFYFGGKFSGYHALPTFTVGDIAELGYWMNHSNSQVESDFFLQIFTAPKNDGTDFGSFYNARLTAVPPEANDGNPSWTPDEWNEFSTDPSADNQLYFYLEDNQTVSTTPRTLQDLQTNPFTHDGTDYGQSTDEVFAVAVLTNSKQTEFEGHLDDINLELTSGQGSLSIDLEP
ncbi:MULTISPECIES: TasA family protein [Halorussus]|uniref:TasA family protein n=1 Tax=Halorussus TaxID=1070314 RepID=UPI000E2163A0|nr:MULTISPECIES: TasA family protein [Halorussus]NHN61156.1 hypothetical protein [Halorussus sp. JP-T4]